MDVHNCFLPQSLLFLLVLFIFQQLDELLSFFGLFCGLELLELALGLLVVADYAFDSALALPSHYACFLEELVHGLELIVGLVARRPFFFAWIQDLAPVKLLVEGDVARGRSLLQYVVFDLVLLHADLVVVIN